MQIRRIKASLVLRNSLLPEEFAQLSLANNFTFFDQRYPNIYNQSTILDYIKILGVNTDRSVGLFCLAQCMKKSQVSKDGVESLVILVTSCIYS